MSEFKKLEEGIWEIERQGEMRVPARIFTNIPVCTKVSMNCCKF